MAGSAAEHLPFLRDYVSRGEDPAIRSIVVSMSTNILVNVLTALAAFRLLGLHPGPDIALAAWLRRNELALPPFYLLGDRNFFADRAKTLGLKVELAETRPEDASAQFASALPVVATGQVATARPGAPDETSANWP